MFRKRAEALFNELRDQTVGGWRVDRLIDHGKSAVVFDATSGHQRAALKVFDQELVEQYGVETQLSRIDRELSLCDKRHPNLVQIYDGGRCERTTYLYLAMERVDGQPLSKLLNDIHRDEIHRIVMDVAKAAQFLEQCGLAHRDIKPDNIVYSRDLGTATLLDLGVLRPIDSVSNMTDDATDRPFVGTLQYSPPEFLLREEEDSPEGWRAVTFYQLGAVLFDLLERRPIFHDQTPYARLVNAVQHTLPTFSVTDVPSNLTRLSTNCLHKNPQVRLRLVRWADFDGLALYHGSRMGPKERVRQRLKELPSVARAGSPTSEIARRTLQRMLRDLQSRVRQWCVEQPFLPPVEIQDFANQSSTAQLDIHFRPHSPHQLDRHIRIRVCVELLDVDTEVVELTASASVSETPRTTVSDNTVRFYSGTVFRDLVDEELGPLVYAIFDAVLTGRVVDGDLDVERLLLQEARPDE